MRFLTIVPIVCFAINGFAAQPRMHGNGLNPNGTPATQSHDPRGIATFKQSVSRSPAGLLYDTPNAPRECAEGSWCGSISVGALGNDGDEESQRHNEYIDWDSTLLFSARLANQIDALRAIELDVGALSREDQFAQLTYQSAGNYSVALKHSSLRHEFTDNTVAFFTGIGSDYLGLPGDLVPGANTQAEIDLALGLAGSTDLALERTFNGLTLKYTPSDKLEILVDYTGERRDGERPFGGSFLPTFYAAAGAGGVVETIEPIDYLTHNFSLALSGTMQSGWYALSYSGSLFENDNEALTFENPFRNNAGPAAFVAEFGRFALYPDNESHSFKLDLGSPIGRGQLAASASWTAMRQDEDLLPHTINTGVTDGGQDLDDWNTLAALSQATADAEIDNLLLYVQLTQAITNRLSLRARARHEERDVKTDYTSFNPITDQYGYVAVDGSFFTDRVFVPGFNRAGIQYRSIPFDTSKTTVGLSFDWRAAPKTTLGLDLERVEVERDNREVTSANDDKLTFRLATRAISWATVNLSASTLTRDGDDYVANPYDPFFSVSLPGYGAPSGPEPPYFTLNELRMFDVADKEHDKIKLRIRFLIRDDMDLSVQWQTDDHDFDATYGLTKDESSVVSVDFNYQPSLGTSVYAFWSALERDQSQRNIRNFGARPDGSAGGASFPSDRTWRENARDKSSSYGLGIAAHGTRVAFTSDLSVTDGTTEIDYSYATGAALATPAAAEPSGVGTFPDLESKTLHWINELKWRLPSDVQVTVFHRLDAGKLDDWHYDGLVERIGNQLYLGADFADYEIHSFGISVDYEF